MENPEGNLDKFTNNQWNIDLNDTKAVLTKTFELTQAGKHDEVYALSNLHREFEDQNQTGTEKIRIGEERDQLEPAA